jgi:hypothetical protein
MTQKMRQSMAEDRAKKKKEWEISELNKNG